MDPYIAKLLDDAESPLHGDINIGYATVPFDQSKKGWRVPGGGLIKSKMIAERCARNIDRLIRESGRFSEWKLSGGYSE